jgi:hypothetical protein
MVRDGRLGTEIGRNAAARVSREGSPVTYFVRGAVVSLAMFFLVYTALSILVAFGWRRIRNQKRSISANFLYGLRIFPLVSAVAAAALLIVPSFLYLEPFRNDERVDIPALALAGGGIVVVVLGLFSAFWAWWQTLRFAASCDRDQPFRFESLISAVEISAPGPVILVAGIRRPMLFISRQARELLDHREMQMAIQHEMAHVRFRDNLKKLMLRLCRFPFLGELERSWARAVELAADDAAAGDESSALDLASALLKIAAGPQFTQMPGVAMGLVATSDGVLQERIERLLAWQPRAGRQAQFHPGPATFVILAVLIAAYVPVLGQVHALTELLVR